LLSLVEEFGLAEMNGWVLLCRAVVAGDNGDPRSAERWVREAREIARAGGDTDLELCAMSELGAALVETGRAEEGSRCWTRRWPVRSREADSPNTVVFASCRTVTCSSRGGEVDRATQWLRAADDFNRRDGSPHLYTTCRTHYGSVLFAAGVWEQAEEELRAALKR
jgi:hypothetical protein